MVIRRQINLSLGKNEDFMHLQAGKENVCDNLMSFCIFELFFCIISQCIPLEILTVWLNNILFCPVCITGSLTVEDGSTIILCVLFSIIISWFLLDNFVFEKYTRYTFTVFPVFILGLSGLVAKLQNGGSTTNLILACLILEFSVLALIFRVALFVYRLKKRRATLPSTKSEILNDQEAVAKL